MVTVTVESDRTDSAESILDDWFGLVSVDDVDGLEVSGAFCCVESYPLVSMKLRHPEDILQMCRSLAAHVLRIVARSHL